MRDCKVEEVVVKSNLRGAMDEFKLNELAASIAEKGILQPLIARSISGNGTGKVELVCGHRRLKAAKMAGMKTVPVIVKDLTDEDVIEVQIIENLQRDDLNPIDEARGFKSMLAMNKYTHEDLGSKVGKSASYVGDRVELLKLDEKMIKAMYEGVIVPAHGKVLLRIKDLGDRKRMFEEITRGKLSARAAENLLTESEFGDNYFFSLDDVNFDKGQCKECPQNGSNYKDLVDPDTETEGCCFNKQCYLKKQKETVDEQIKRQKEDGVKVVQEATAFKKINKYETGEFDKETVKMLGNSYKEECRKCKDFAVVTSKGYRGILQLEARCFKKKCLQAKISGGKKELAKAERTKEAVKGKKGEPSGPDPQLVAMRKARDITRKTLSARAFWINVLFSSRTERMANTLVLSGILQSLTYSGRERVLNKELGITKEIRGVAALYKVTTNEQVLKCIQAVCSSKISEHSSADLEFLASEAKKTIAKDFVITNDYLEKLNKEQLVALAKEIKIDKALVKAGRDPGKMFNVKKDVLVTYFTGGTMKLDGIVPKEMVAFTGKKANNY